MITAVFYTAIFSGFINRGFYKAVFSGFINRGIDDDNRGFLYSGF